MYKLTKKFRFETAHKLSLGYCGKCANKHGHSWNGKIVIQTEDLDEYGMAMDFKDLKAIVEPLVAILDHGLLLHISEKKDLDVSLLNQEKVIVFEENPTSEVVARMLWTEWQKRMPAKVKLFEIQIDETCTSECSYIATENHTPVNYQIFNGKF